MTKDEALKLALDALENISTALRENDVLGSDSELMLNAITAIEEALDECDEDELIIRYHEMTIKRLEKRIEELTAQPQQSIWVNLTVDELIDLEHKHLRHEDLVQAIKAKLREKNT